MRWQAFRRSPLRQRILLLTGLSILLMVATLGITSYISVRESLARSVEDRKLLAQAVAAHIDYVMRQNLAWMQEVRLPENLAANDRQSLRRALHDVYLHSIFVDGIFLIDPQGHLLGMEPYSRPRAESWLLELEWVRRAILAARPLVSDVLVLEETGERLVVALVPVRNGQGKLVGFVGGLLDLTGQRLEELVRPSEVGLTAYIEIVDSQGIILASSRQERKLLPSDHGGFMANLIRTKQSAVGTCHSCHTENSRPKETEVMAFAPVALPRWGVSVRQPAAQVLAPARRLEQRFLILGVAMLLIGIVLAWGLTQSFLKPLGVLTGAAERIAAGNLSEPIPVRGQDELARLAANFDAMRLKLKDSLDTLQSWNVELEQRVKKRTAQLEERTRELSRLNAEREKLMEELRQKEGIRSLLLRKVISAQEEERKRLARELHDDTSQQLTAVMMALEMGAQEKSGSPQQRSAGENARQVVASALEGVHRIMFDLRPALLDDLGLRSAIAWLAHRDLRARHFRVVRCHRGGAPLVRRGRNHVVPGGSRSDQ